MTVLDTNIVIYLLAGRLNELPEAAGVYVSIISEIELLSHDRLRHKEETMVRAFLASVDVVGLTSGIKESAIALRRRHRLTVPDAIIAATAVSLEAELLSNDGKLAGVPGLRCRSLPLRPA